MIVIAKYTIAFALFGCMSGAVIGGIDLALIMIPIGAVVGFVMAMMCKDD